jgi:Zn-dependent peptidase ImmA (M78 family)/DNA-binding XRE family transcriptional regulator
MFLPQNLTLARQRRGLKKTQLAKKVGLSNQTITYYEAGTHEPTRTHAEALADVLEFPVAFFYDDSMAEPIGVNGASFRALTRMTATQRDGAIAAGAFCIRLNDWIEERFEIAEVDLPDLQAGLIDPEGAAMHVRGAWKIGLHPISNMLHLAEGHGVRVFALPLACHEVDAFSFWAGHRPFVCLGTHKTPERAVFDLAHELGHLILHKDHAAPRGRDEERQADAFASALLMPEADVLAHSPSRFPTFEDLANAKARWRVSVAALNFRLHKLGTISEWHYREMCIAISQYGRNREPNSIRREQSYVLDQVFRTMRAEGVKRGDIASAINIPLTDLEEMIAGLTFSVIAGDEDMVDSGDGAHRRPNLRLV